MSCPPPYHVEAKHHDTDRVDEKHHLRSFFLLTSVVHYANMIAKVEHYQHFNSSYLSKMILRVININLVYCILNNTNVGTHHSDILVRSRKLIGVIYSDNNILHLNSILTATAFHHLGWVGGGKPENREGLRASFGGQSALGNSIGGGL